MTELAKTPACTVARLGRFGDGIIETPTHGLPGSVAVAGVLPGEHVVLDDTVALGVGSEPGAEGVDGTAVVARYQRSGAASTDRIEPVCRHFTHCGGCAVQHVGPRLYVAWKREIVVEAFAREALSPQIGPLVGVPTASRRRVVLTARRERGTTRLGYHARGTHDLVAIVECPIAVPAINTRLEGLAQLADAVSDRHARAPTLRLTVTACTHGLDISITGDTAPLEIEHRRRVAALAAEHGLARVVIEGEEVVRSAAATLEFAGIAVELPPGAFVQAVEAGEAAMVERVVAAVGKAARVADLFAGLGTFTLPLAHRAEVTAFDTANDSLAALTAAARGATGIRPILARRRDLAREPLSARELTQFDAIVLDPPRAGAGPQCERLARAEVPVAVLVSCNPVTLARDCRLLVDGGWLLESVEAIDQFLYSPHVEAVAVLRRTRKRARPGRLV